MKRGRFWTGFLGAIMIGWMTLALVFGLDAWIFGQRIRHSQAPLLMVSMLAIHLTLLPFVGFASGFTCAFFWHSFVKPLTCERWGTPVILLILAPLLLLLLTSQDFEVALPLFAVSFALALSTFHRGIQVGFRWWRDNYWRHFLGASNDWERDETD